ncbi:hypothetical protein BASA81_000001 [Batrachochytrium salamandrivorans]|nr:hypothetical protein BASA81_000001 [Batrachochytrium salamandrivorans]
MNSSVDVPGPSTCTQEASDVAFDDQSWIISVCLAIFAALVNNFGLNLQKLAWTKKQSNVIRKSVYSTYWAVGMIFIIMASVLDFVALAFGPQSVIAPLGSLTMVANAFIAPWMHGEKLQPGVVKATVIIIVGCITAVAAASHVNNICSLEALFALYLTGRFILYAMIVGGILFAIYVYIKKCERVHTELGQNSAAYQSLLRFHRISYAAESGIFGAQSVLFARTITQAFTGSLRGGTLFLLNPAIYLVFVCLVGCIVLQIYWLNQGLARFESLYNVPIFTSSWIVGTVLGGGIFYGEFSTFSVAQAVLFPMGVILCCVGVFFLAQDSPSEMPPGGGIGEGSENASEDLEASQQQQQHFALPTHQDDDMRDVDIMGFPTSKSSNKAPLVSL